ncbi:hypothetical protein B0H16DRAFT_347028 [Mycena metata]|uniref:F-box domain-containing protein n=1 Tax=Mycena metata TaxID=1033252 RepID=A0AAD7HKB3_9AGAR|nr:hypothetical protein B0H16DRAFT_347028 [Mycena metata]
MLDYLPVELILLVLRGSSITDIFNLSRTASLFRDISLTNRGLWIDASDCYKIRLPLGETLKTTDLTRILCDVARSVSILYKLQPRDLVRPVSPIRTYEATHLYGLPPWSFWSPLRYAQPTFVGHFPPTFMNVLPGGRSFLFGSVAHLGVYDVQGEYGIALDVPFCGRFDPRPGDTTMTVDWDSVDNGAHIAVVVISKAFNEHHHVESYLSVFAVNHSPLAATPSVYRTHIFPLPLDASAVSIKGSLVLVRSSDAFVIVDLKSSQSGWWLLDADCKITAAAIHSAERTISIVVNSPKSGTRSVQSIDLPLMPGTPLAIPFRFTPRTVHVLPPTKSCYASHGAIQFLAADDVTLCEVIHLSDGRSVISSTSIDRDPRRRILGVDSTSHIVQQPLSTLRASYHTLFAAVRQHTLALMREDGGCVGGTERFLELSLPSERMPAVGRTVAFDDVYGIALAFEQGRLFVVQY